MLRWLGLLVAVCGFGIFAGSLLLEPPLECQVLRLTKTRHVSASPERYCGRPQEKLRAMWDSLETERVRVEARIEQEEARFTERMMELSQRHRTRRDDAIIEEPKVLKDLRLQHVNIIVEQNDIRSAMRIHDLQVGAIALGAGSIGLLLFALTFVGGLFSGQRPPAVFRKSIRHRDVEQWLDPGAAELTVANLDDSKQAATRTLWSLQPKRCDYCSAKLQHDEAGQIQHVTIYKKAPSDVKNPKKIILGRGYRAVPSDEIVCAQCGHIHRL